MRKHPDKSDTAPGADSDEEALRKALKDVAPLVHADRASLRKAPPPPLPLQRERDDRQVLADSLSDDSSYEAGLETGEELVFLRSGLPNQVLRKLRRGQWVIQDHIDLHGLRTDEARPLLAGFLAGALRAGHRCVRIVHGKGLRSENREPVLKRKVGNWLAQRDEVLAFVQARPEDGGSGAVVVLLKGT